MKEMKRFCWLALGLAALASGCASGPKYAKVRDSIPACNPEHGRVYFYRTVVAGAAVQPSIMMNGEKIGDAKPKGFFFVDKPPGNYEVSTKTEVKRSLSLTLDKGQTKYVRLGMSVGFFVGHVYPELVEPAEGQKQLEKCKYTGPELCPK